MPIPYRKVNCGAPGISRRRRGRGFEYLDVRGKRVDDAETIARIRALGIPPAWKDVWICADPRGHLQAVGTDAAGRKQYIYHEAWHRRRDQQKFDNMVEFARSLPEIRSMTGEHLALPGMPRERALACAVRLLDRGFFRVGGEAYAEKNRSYGLATMRKEHVTLKGKEVIFEYVAKSGKERIQSVVDPLVFDAVAQMKRRRGGGAELLAYKDATGWRDVRSSDINDYLKDVADDDYSAKDFRTWHATVHCTLALAVSYAAASSKTARKRAVTRAVKEVAHYLGNTPVVCRRSYIDPRVIDRFDSGVVITGIVEQIAEHDAMSEGSLAIVEEAVLDLLAGDMKSDLLEKVA
ncbi:MAG: DNA topoisomerase IB [Actinomycetota bacterium]